MSEQAINFDQLQNNLITMIRIMTPIVIVASFIMYTLVKDYILQVGMKLTWATPILSGLLFTFVREDIPVGIYYYLSGIMGVGILMIIIGTLKNKLSNETDDNTNQRAE